MSRRMLLEDNYSENGLMPVTDGLICWLDGRDGKTGDTIWKDRSGNNNNAQFHVIHTNSIFKNNSLYFNGVANIKNPTLGLDEYTVEVYMKDLNTGYWNGLWGNYSYNKNTGNNFYKGTSKTLDGYPTSIWSENYITGKDIMTFVCKNNCMSIYINDKKIDNSAKINPSTAEYFVIFARKTNLAINDSIDGTDARLNEWYSYKIYNRALTKEEIQQNYEYEQSIERG